jgi:hypothetical protein
MSPFFIIVALLAAAIICSVESVNATIVIALAVVAVLIALFSEMNGRELFARRQ